MKLMRLMVILLPTILTFSPPAVLGQSVDDLSIMTENYPPYNFEKDGRLQGISVDLMVLMLEKVGSRQDRSSIRLLPWARGYQLLLRKPGTCLFSTTRTKERETLFKWVGPISKTTISLVARKDRHATVRSKADIAKYKVGVVVDDVGEQLLLQQGVPPRNLDRIAGVGVTRLSIRKLNQGRIDLWSYEENVARWEIKAMGLDPEDYTIAYVLSEGELYFAVHRDTPESLITTLQQALDEIKGEDRYQEILNRYLE